MSEGLAVTGAAGVAIAVTGEGVTQPGGSKIFDRAEPVTMGLLRGTSRYEIVRWLQTLGASDYSFAYMQDSEVEQWLHSHPTYSILYYIERDCLYDNSPG